MLVPESVAITQTLESVALGDAVTGEMPKAILNSKAGAMKYWHTCLCNILLSHLKNAPDNKAHAAPALRAPLGSLFDGEQLNNDECCLFTSHILRRHWDT